MINLIGGSSFCHFSGRKRSAALLLQTKMIMTDQVEIATVDYAEYTSGDESRKKAFIKKLGDAFAEIGFAIVENHGVSEDLRAELFKVSEQFFSQSQQVKDKYENEALSGQRGYIGCNKETAKGFETPDMKEFYHIGQQLSDTELAKEKYPSNIWPENMPKFQEVVSQVYTTFENTGRNLLRALALYLDLDENYFDDKIYQGNSILRLLHYYPIKNVENIPPGAVRAAAHGDINLITLLMGASAEGLQAQTASGDWIDVAPKPNQIVINMGDMMERLTNKRLKSTIHRVINPSPEKLGTSRYSTPFFLHPRSNMDLTCLASCVDDQHPKLYEDITAGDYLNERLLELGLKKN